jgi:hypothetical protein
MCLTFRLVFYPLNILKVYITVSQVRLALQVLKLACVDDSWSVPDEHALSREALR